VRFFLSLRQVLMDSRSGLGARTRDPDRNCGYLASDVCKCAAGELSELQKVFGGDVGGVIPDPIPNSEVKPSRADGTARGTAWESRTLPELIPKPCLV
jgi:hypothetical protein